MAHVAEAGRTNNRYQVTEVSAESKTKISASEQRLTRQETDAIQDRTDRYGKATLPADQAERLEGGVTVQPGESVTVSFDRVEDPEAPYCPAEEYALAVMNEDGEVTSILEDTDGDGSITLNWGDGNEGPVTAVPMVIGAEGLDGEIDVSIESTHPVAEGQPIPEWDGDSWELASGDANFESCDMAELGLEEAADESAIPFDQLLDVNAVPPGEARPPEDLGDTYAEYLRDLDDGEHLTEVEWERRTQGTSGTPGSGSIETAGGVEYRFTEDGQVEMYVPGQHDEAAALTWTQDGMVEERDGTDPYHGQVDVDGDATSPVFINVDESGAQADYDGDGNLTGFTVQNGDAVVHATYDRESGWTFEETEEGGAAWRNDLLEDPSNPVYTVGGYFDPENGGYGDILTYTGSNVSNPTAVVTGTAGEGANEISVPTTGEPVPFVRDTDVLPAEGTIAYEQALRQQIADIQAGAFAEQRDAVLAAYEEQLGRPLTDEEVEAAEAMLRMSIDQQTSDLTSSAEFLIAQSEALRAELEALYGDIPGSEIAPFVPDGATAPATGAPMPATGGPAPATGAPATGMPSGAPISGVQGQPDIDALFSDPAMFLQLLMSVFGYSNPTAGWGGIDGLMGSYPSELGATYDWDRYMMMNDVVGALFALMGGYGAAFGSYDPMMSMMYSSNGTVRP